MMDEESAKMLMDDSIVKNYKRANSPENKTLARYFLSIANDHLTRAAEDIRMAQARTPTAEQAEVLAVLQRRLGEIQMKVNELKRKL